MIMRKCQHVYVCGSGSQIKFTRENIMESFFFLQFPRRPEKRHDSSYHTTTGDYIVIICLYPDGRRIFDRTAETTFVVVVLSLRLLGLVVSESRVPSISFLGGIFTRWVAPVSVQGRRILLVPVMGANTVDYNIKPRCLLNNIHHPLP